LEPCAITQKAGEETPCSFFEPDEDHWHGAAPGRFMTHIAMQETDDSGSPAAWDEHVTDEEYGAAPAL
jgi:hypothetical protein